MSGVPNQPLSKDEVTKLLHGFKAGRSTRAMQKELNCNLRTVVRYYARFREEQGQINLVGVGSGFLGNV